MQLNSHIVIWWQGTAWHPYKQTSDKGYGKNRQKNRKMRIGAETYRNFADQENATQGGIHRLSQTARQPAPLFLFLLAATIMPGIGTATFGDKTSAPLGLVAREMFATAHCLAASIACIICAIGATESPGFSNPEEKEQERLFCCGVK